MNTARRIFQCALLFLSSAMHADEGGFDATIPVLDMNEYFQSDTKEQFIDQLRSALKEVGFFAVINTGVDSQVLDSAYQTAVDFFRLPLEEKMKVHCPEMNGQRGYVPGESAKGESRGDFKEFYHIGREEHVKNTPWPNVWPEGMNLKQPLNELFDVLEAYKVPLEHAMAEAIGESSDLFTRMTSDGDVLLRAIHYPATPDADQIWAAEHTDIDLFTILPRATAEGLQVKNQQGEWIDVKVPENAFIVNCGDMMENITNGEFHSGLHRVIAKQGDYERYSMVLFIHPKSEDRLDPLPGCIARTGGEQKYPHANRIELLAERLVDLGLASPFLMQMLAESGFMERAIKLGRASPKAMKKLQEAGLASPSVLHELSLLSSE